MSHVEPGQVYESADPRGGPNIRVLSLCGDSAWVEDAITGKRKRWVLLGSLHASAMTALGRPWRTGYVLKRAGGDQ